jgi:hypothetical protein
MSGSFVFLSGVGTQMLIVSTSASAAKSAVARSMPFATSCATRSVGTSSMYDAPRLIESTFASFTSMLVTLKPAEPSSTASGRPT